MLPASFFSTLPQLHAWVSLQSDQFPIMDPPPFLVPIIPPRKLVDMLRKGWPAGMVATVEVMVVIRLDMVLCGLLRPLPPKRPFLPQSDHAKKPWFP